MIDTLSALPELRAATAAASTKPAVPDRGISQVELRGVSKAYGAFEALHQIDLSIRQGEFVTLLGPSGSGKTTLLNLIAGMVVPTSGRVFIGGRDATAVPPRDRGLGMVFQSYALMPHMTVFENIAFPLRVRRVPNGEIRRRVKDVLDVIRLPHIADRKPAQLSGGQQQRVSLARCIVYNPSLILMDEPLGALDRNLREQMQLEIKRLHDNLRITILYVTHDQDEALSMSDRIALMNQGRIEQIGPPEELYFRPCSVFAAEFLGSSNLIRGVATSSGERVLVRTSQGTFAAPIPKFSTPEDDEVALLIRPENVSLLQGGELKDGNRVEGLLQDSIVLGGIVRHYVKLADGTTVVVQELNHPGRRRARRGEAVAIGWRWEDGLILPKEGG